MKPLPISIDPCPIHESVIEIRFLTEFPSEAVFGVLYSSVNEVFQGGKPISLPISQIPEQIRNTDTNLKYQAHYRIPKGNLSLSIGPRTLVIANTNSYIGWDKFSKIVFDVIENTKKVNLIKSVERIGLRYINHFNTDILTKINANLKLYDVDIKDERTTIRTELADENIIKILQIGNLVPMNINGKASIGSLIDIDCIYNLNVSAGDFYSKYRSWVEIAHAKEKEAFFNLLKPEFLKLFHPKYS